MFYKVTLVLIENLKIEHFSLTFKITLRTQQNVSVKYHCLSLRNALLLFPNIYKIKTYLYILNRKNHITYYYIQVKCNYTNFICICYHLNEIKISQCLE